MEKIGEKPWLRQRARWAVAALGVIDPWLIAPFIPP